MGQKTARGFSDGAEFRVLLFWRSVGEEERLRVMFFGSIRAILSFLMAEDAVLAISNTWDHVHSLGRWMRFFLGLVGSVPIHSGCGCIPDARRTGGPASLSLPLSSTHFFLSRAMPRFPLHPARLGGDRAR